MVPHPQESTAISVSVPVTSVSTDGSKTPTGESKDRDIQDAEVSKNFKKANPRRASTVPALSPGSASSSRRSSRLNKV